MADNNVACFMTSCAHLFCFLERWFCLKVCWFLCSAAWFLCSAVWFLLACLPSTWQIYAGIIYEHMLACDCVLYRYVNILGSPPILSALWRRWGHTCAIAMLNVLACATVQSRVKSTRLAWHTNFAHFVCTSNAKHTSWSPRRVDIRNTGSKQYRPSQERGTTRTM